MNVQYVEFPLQNHIVIDNKEGENMLKNTKGKVLTIQRKKSLQRATVQLEPFLPATSASNGTNLIPQVFTWVLICTNGSSPLLIQR